MNDFSYHNIFETKGMEYILTIIFFAILIPFWMILNRKVKVRESIQKSLGVLTMAVLKIPKGLLYTKSHTWTHMEKSGVARIGMDDFIQHITGKMEVKDLLLQGNNVKKGDVVATIEQNGKQLKIKSPVSGTIASVNNNLLDEPELLNLDPYGKGWLYAIEPTGWKTETKSCLMAEDAMNWAKNELERFKDFLAGSMKKYSPDIPLMALQDGGELVDNTLSGLSEDIWKDFQQEFLD